MLAALMIVPLLGPARAEETPPDSTIDYPEKLPARSNWERAISFPGQLAYAPVRYSALGLGYAGIYLVESGAVRRLSELLSGTGIAPVYAPRTGGGLTYFAEHFLVDDAFLIVTATTWLDYRQLYALEWNNIGLGGGFYSDYSLRYRSLTDEDFFGIGPHTSHEDELQYAVEDALLEISFRKDVTTWLSTQVDLGISNTSVFRSRNDKDPSVTDVYSDSTLPGVREKVRLQGIEYSLRFDDTNDPGHPTAGRVGKIGMTLFTDVKDDRFSFWKFGMDLTQHLHLIYDRTLVLRAACELTQGIDDPDIPFYHLADLGDYRTIRGFSRGRFRDKDAVFATAEYRYPVWIPWAKVVDAVAFVDGGQVANNIFEDATLPDWQVGYGGGFRFYGPAGLIAKTEIAFSKEGYRFYLTLNS